MAQGFSAALTEFAAELKIDAKPAPELGPQVDGCLDLHPECAKWANAVRKLNPTTCQSLSSALKRTGRLVWLVWGVVLWAKSLVEKSEVAVGKGRVWQES